MAKGNLFQGMARGKVGDVVFSRLDGQQISRVRNRNPKNPRTNAQLYQRAIMATVMAAYSYGKEIFDHSFEGYSVGAGCQRRFISENAKLMRATIADYINSETSMAAVGPRVTAPGLSVVVPNALKISEGSLTNDFMTVINYGGSPKIHIPEPIYDPSEGHSGTETLGDYFNRCGLKAGDIFTIVWVINNPADVLYTVNPLSADAVDKLFRGHFGWVRFTVRGDVDLTLAINNFENYSDVFFIEFGGDGQDVDPAFSPLAGGADFMAQTVSKIGSTIANASNGFAIGVIRSRDNEKLRSNESLTIFGNDGFGVVPTAIPQVWKAGTVQLGASDLILEGV